MRNTAFFLTTWLLLPSCGDDGAPNPTSSGAEDESESTTTDNTTDATTDAGDGDGDGDGGEMGGGTGDPGDPLCGNGVREGQEDCDEMDLDGMACDDFEYGAGTLACNDECEFDLSECCLAAGQSCDILNNECCEGQCLNLTLMFKCE